MRRHGPDMGDAPAISNIPAALHHIQHQAFVEPPERAEKSGIGLVSQLKIATGFSDDPRLMTPEQRAYDQLSGSLTVYPVPLSNVIAIKYVSRNGETAASIANALTVVPVSLLWMEL